MRELNANEITSVSGGFGFGIYGTSDTGGPIWHGILPTLKIIARPARPVSGGISGIRGAGGTDGGGSWTNTAFTSLATRGVFQVFRGRPGEYKIK